MLPEGALWIGESHIDREAIRALPLELLARTVDVLLDRCRTYPYAPEK